VGIEELEVKGEKYFFMEIPIAELPRAK